MTLTRAAIPILILLMLSACAEYTAAGIERKKQYSDTESMVFRNAPCAMTVGAYHRNLNDQERAAVDILCGGDMLPILNRATGLLEER